MKGDSLVLAEAMKRIRELEAELARFQAVVKMKNDWQIRAEKAEARVAELRNLVEKGATKTQLLRFLEAREREAE